MIDAVFLHEHPGWSARDLDDAPEELVRLLSWMTSESNRMANERRRQAG